MQRGRVAVVEESQVVNTEATSSVPQTTSAASSKYIEVERCDEGDSILCLGSGKRKVADTENTSVWSLVSKDGILRYGIIETDSKQIFVLTVR